MTASSSWRVRHSPAELRSGPDPALLAALDALASRDRVPPWALEDVLAGLPPELDEAERSSRQSLVAALAALRGRAR